MSYKKCVAKGLLQYMWGKELKVYSDYYQIEEAYVDNKGRLIITFQTLEDLQEWNEVIKRKRRERIAQINNKSILCYPNAPFGPWRTFYDNPFHLSVWGKQSQLEMTNFNYDYCNNEYALWDGDDYEKCYDCGRVVSINDTTEVSGGERVCQDCLDDWYTYCDECEEYHHNDDMVKVYRDPRGSHNWRYICEDCANQIAHQCEDCGDWYEDDSMQQAPDGTWYCESCFGNHCCTCERCGDVIWNDDARYDEDSGGNYCESCYAEVCQPSEEDCIRSYHNNPIRHYHYAKGEERHDRLIGTEVETDSKEDNLDERQEITWRHGDEEEYIYQMHDGSLSSYGIECITQPMSKAFWDNFDFESWMSKLADAGARSHDTTTCGLHVHLSREWLGTHDRDEQALLVGRMRQFLADNKPEVQCFARRTEERWCNYTKSFEKDNKPITKDERCAKHKEKGKSGDRYQSINNTNSATIEFRIFKGTLKTNTYRASVEFCLRVVDYILTHEENTETWQDFLTYKELPQSMLTYMQERGMQTTF